jgi:hypothetical protein
MGPNNSFKPNATSGVGLILALDRTLMINPYQSPISEDRPLQGESHRYAYAFIAFLSGILFPPVFRTAATLVLFGNESSQLRGNLSFWSSVACGSIIAFVFAQQFKRMPLWLAFLLGPAGFALCLTGWVVWYVVSAV